MSKTKIANRSSYEILFIVPNKFTESEAKAIIDNTEKMIVENGGNISYREYWGKKKLAYEIKHQWYGYYNLFVFELDGEKLQKIDQTLRLSTDILRHQIVKAEFSTPEEIAKQKEKQEQLNATSGKKKPAINEEKAIKSEEQAEEKIETEKDEKKADLKDLDEKLDGILETNNLV